MEPNPDKFKRVLEAKFEAHLGNPYQDNNKMMYLPCKEDSEEE